MADSLDTNGITPDILRDRKEKKWVEYPGTIGMWIAESDFGVAEPIQSAIEKAVKDRHYGYIPTIERKALREACAEWYSHRYGAMIEPDRIRFTSDVLQCLRIALIHFSSPGSPVVLPTPAYMPFRPLCEALGHPVVQVPMIVADGEWQMDIPAIRAALTPEATLLLCNPHNPTGRVFRREEFEAVADAVTDAGARVFSDEIHAPLAFTGHQHIYYAGLSEATAEHTITATSASKAWNMPGLRCAQVLFSTDEDARRYDKSGGWESDTEGILGVIANTAAYRLGEEWLDDFIQLVTENVALVEKELPRLLPEAQFIAPEGTYLIWIDVRAYGLPEPADVFLRKSAGVSVVDGRFCGDAGRGFIRLNLATTPAIVEEALTRIARAIGRASV